MIPAYGSDARRRTVAEHPAAPHPDPADWPAPRPRRDQRAAPPCRRARRRSASCAGRCLLGGLVIIADLAAHGRDPAHGRARTIARAIGTVDEILNFVLFSILGIVVVRDTGLIYLGVIAGVFAALLDASWSPRRGIMAPTRARSSAIEEYFVSNLVIGIVFAGVSGVVYVLVQRWSGGRRTR